MVDTDAIDVIRRMHEHIDDNIEQDQTQVERRARDLYTYLNRDGGEVEPLDTVECYRTEIDKLGTWSADEWTKAVYGIDASTTRPIEYQNGLVTDTAHAKLGVDSHRTNRDLEMQGTVVTMAHYDDDETTLHSERFDNDRIDAEMIFSPQFERRGRTQNVTDDIAKATRTLAESRHAKKMVDEIEGPLFLDGSIYPLGVIHWVMLDSKGRESPANTWDKPREIVQNYVGVIETHADRELPVMGIVKTSTTHQVLDALNEKLTRADDVDDFSLPWRRDHQFISQVLRHDSLEHLTYTSWFMHKKAKFEDHKYEVLEEFDLDRGGPEEYRRCFFYVRLPKKEVVLRVEAPYLMVDTEEKREKLQNKALKEIARNKDVPQAVKRADRIARLTQDNRERIRDMLTGTDYSRDYNWDGRWSDIDTKEEPT